MKQNKEKITCECGEHLGQTFNENKNAEQFICEECFQSVDNLELP